MKLCSGFFWGVLTWNLYMVLQSYGQDASRCERIVLCGWVLMLYFNYKMNPVPRRYVMHTMRYIYDNPVLLYFIAETSCESAIRYNFKLWKHTKSIQLYLSFYIYHHVLFIEKSTLLGLLHWFTFISERFFVSYSLWNLLLHWDLLLYYSNLPLSLLWSTFV
jgi:hypothetical protein